MNNSIIEISTKSLISNIKNYRKILPKDGEIMAVVKANAYGHGIDIVSNSAVEAGVDSLAVFDFSDAVHLRKQHKDIPILVLKQIDADNLETAAKLNIDITVSSLEVLKEIVSFKNNSKLLINIKVDTGLSRQGFTLDEMPKVIDILNKNSNIQIVSIYTHLIGAENKEFDQYTKLQAEDLRLWQIAFNDIGIYPMLHASATSGYLMQKDLAFDAVRMGIGMYGLYPSTEVKQKNNIKLSPALTWKTKIEQVKTINKNDVVAYNATYVAKGETKIAVLPVGYYDGLPRELSNKGYMLCGGVKCPILGRVMMNMCVIDVTKAKNVKKGSEVVIIGKQGKNEITAEELASLANTINYEIVTRINPSIIRIAK